MSIPSEIIDDLLHDGWISFMPKNELGWRFFFKRDPDPANYHAFFGWGWLYKTVFPSGRIADGIIETKHQRYVRRRAEIIFRDFRDYPWRRSI